MLGDLVGGQWLLDIGFHQQYRLGQLRMAGAEAILQRDALALVAFANALHHQLPRPRAGQFSAMVAGQQRQQQVEYRHAAAGGHAIAIPLEQVIGGDDLGEALGEVIVPTPVHRGAIAVEQAELGQRVDAGGQRADRRSRTRQLLERQAQRWRHRRRRLVGDQEQPRALLQPAVPGRSRQAPALLFGRRFGEQEQRLVERLGCNRRAARRASSASDSVSAQVAGQRRKPMRWGWAVMGAA